MKSAKEILDLSIILSSEEESELIDAIYDERYAIFDEDEELVGIKPDAPEEVKAYFSRIKLEEEASNTGDGVINY